MVNFIIAVLVLSISLVSTLSARDSDFVLKNNIAHSDTTALQFSEEERVWLKENKTVSVVGDANWFPFEGFDKNGKYVGIVADVLNLISQKSGLVFDVKETESWLHSLDYSNNRHVDIISASANNPIIEKNYRPTHVTIKNPIIMIARNNMANVPNLNNLKDMRIALAGDSGTSNAIMQTYPSVKFTHVSHIDDGLLGVADEQFDLVLMSMAVASYQISELGLYELRIVGVTDVDMELTLFVNRDQPVLWKIINKVKMHESNQERHDILSKWIKQRYIDRYSPERVRLLFLLIAFFVVFVFYRNQLLKKQAKVLLQLSQTDKLTNTHNRLYLDTILSQKMSQSIRYKTNFALIIIDIDYFKKVNDQYGHLTGDKLLVQFALIIKENTRDSDIFGRWGGEEFLIICPETNLQAATILAEKLRDRVATTTFTEVGQKTASFGVSEYKPAEPVDSCLARADNALYCAKDAGRNQVKAEA